MTATISETRGNVAEMLNQRLAGCIDLALQCKQAHWNIKDANFIALHKLFDEIHDAVTEYVDLLAERVVQLGGVAEGTICAVERRTSLAEYPLMLSSGEEHLAALSASLSTFGRVVRRGIDEITDHEDVVSADILTEIARGIDQWLWFVEAHRSPRLSSVPSAMGAAEHLLVRGAAHRPSSTVAAQGEP